MNLKTIEQLLQNAQIILQKDKAEKKENEARGEYFNVFENFEFARNLEFQNFHQKTSEFSNSRHYFRIF